MHSVSITGPSATQTVSLLGTPVAGGLSASGYRVWVPPVLGVQTESRRAAGVRCHEQSGTSECCLQPPRVTRHGLQLQPGHSPQHSPAPASNARRVLRHTQACPRGTGAPPMATTPRWTGGRGSSWHNKAVTKQRHFGSACSEAEST